MKRYSEYKDSGIEWIGEIPSDWEICKLKYAVDIKTDKVNFVEQKYIGLENVESGTGRYIETESQEIDGLSTSFEKGDVLFGKLRPYLAKCIIPSFNGICSSEFLVLRNFHGVNRYLQNFLLSPKIIETINASTYGVKMPRANWSFIGQMAIPLPPAQAQEHIVSYLDHKTAAIDELIADKQKLVTLLQEKRATIISEAVTKGIDKTAKMKDSGIEWIDEIPQNWNVVKLKNLGQIKGRIGFKGYTTKDLVGETTTGRAIVLGGTNIMKSGVLSYEKLTYLSEHKYFESPEIMLKGNEVLITKVGAGTGESALYIGYEERVTINPNVMIFVPNERANSKYISYYFLSQYTKCNIYVESHKSGAQPAINQEFVKNLRVAFPDADTQQEIVAYLDQKTTQIDSLISDINEQIEKLKEYRQAVISEVVTGKVAV